MPVTFTATVSANAPGNGVPTGTVKFLDYFNGSTSPTTLGTATLSGGSASFTTSTTSPLAIGSHKITAVYGGDGNFTTSTSAGLYQSVKKADLLSAHNGSTNPTTENFGAYPSLTARGPLQPRLIKGVPRGRLRPVPLQPKFTTPILAR
jgi:hypothetical protein